MARRGKEAVRTKRLSCLSWLLVQRARWSEVSISEGRQAKISRMTCSRFSRRRKKELARKNCHFYMNALFWWKPDICRLFIWIPKTKTACYDPDFRGPSRVFESHGLFHFAKAFNGTLHGRFRSDLGIYWREKRIVRHLLAVSAHNLDWG